MTVRIAGDGVAARCCAHLLGVPVEGGLRARVPAVMLSEAAQQLMGDVFGRDDLFRGLPRITRRAVKWGAAAVEVPHSAVVISEEALLRALEGAAAPGAEQADWTICSAAPLPPACVEHRFGSRMASVARVEMSSGLDVCWIEAVEQGWLFLNSGWLIGVGAEIEQLLAESSLVRPRIGAMEEAGGRFPASPRMASPLGGEGWIACGSAAMGFDPLCGDGAAHAVREAILASAVIRASGNGDVLGLLAHYEARLTAGFLRHLGVCRQFYSTGGAGDWWRAELASVEEGMDWCRQRLEGIKFRYRLEGVELKENQ